MELRETGKPGAAAVLLWPDDGLDAAVFASVVRSLEKSCRVLVPVFAPEEPPDARVAAVESALLAGYDGRIWGAYGLRGGGSALLSLLAEGKVRVRTCVVEGAVEAPAQGPHQATGQKDFIDLFAEEYKKLDSGARLSAIFSTFELKDKITPQSSDAQVVSVLKQELQSAIDNSFNVLRTRIDRFGVVSPNIQRLETAGRILVELPGVKEPERVRKLLQGSANLEFWETYKLPEIYQQLVAADNVLATILSIHS